MKRLLFLTTIFLLSQPVLATDGNSVEDKAQYRKEQMEANQASREAKKAEMQANFEDRKEALKEKLAAFSDEQKAKRIEHVNEKLATMNKRITDHFVNVLEQLSTVLSRIDARAQTLAGEGVDVGAVQTAIEGANNAIATAKSTVSSQAGKDYTIVLTDEESAKTEVKTTFDTLKADLKTTRAAVVAAREAVHAAATALGGIKNSN